MGRAVAIDEAEVAWNDPRVPVVHELQRPKALRLGEHVVTVASPTAIASPAIEPAHPRSAARRRAREQVTVLLCAFMSRNGLTNGDVAAAVDRSEQHVSQMRRGLRAVTADDLLLMVERLRDVAPSLAALLAGEAK